MKILIIVASLLAITSCGKEDQKEEKMQVDQCLRNKIFKECMELLPDSPTHTKYNDWDEVVEACGEAAFYQSKRMVKHIKEECRAGS